MIGYKFTIIYDDGSSEVVPGVPQASFFSSIVSLYSESKAKTLVRDSHDIARIIVVPELHPVIRDYYKNKKGR